MYCFEIVNMDKLNIAEFNGFLSKNLFTTIEWINFIKETQNGEPIVIRITDEQKLIGYFSGLIVKKFGVKILGSPFNGWTTGYMGFDVIEGYEKINLIEPIAKFLYKTTKCMFIQISDLYIKETQLKNTKYKYVMNKSIELNIDRTDEELFKNFKAACRNFIRQFERRGASIEIAEPDEQFAAEYYEQLQEVFAKQKLVPTYNSTRVLGLIKNLNSDQLLCLRVRNPEGKCIATSIFVGFKKRFYFWGAASFRAFQAYRPNEYMIWYAIKYFREKGYRYFDMYGERDYKNKFRPSKITYPCIMIARFKILLTLRDFAKRLFWVLLRIRGFKNGLSNKISCRDDV